MEMHWSIWGKWISSVEVTSHQCSFHLYQANPFGVGLVAEGVCGCGSWRNNLTEDFSANSPRSALNVNHQAGPDAGFSNCICFSNLFCVRGMIRFSIWAIGLVIQSLLLHTHTHTPLGFPVFQSKHTITFNNIPSLDMSLPSMRL